jgi:stearoyl-CoA desaturase (delta-9 desaturase)
VLAEWLDAMAFWKDAARLLPAAYAAYHLATFAVFLLMLAKFFSIAHVLIAMAIATAIATVYNTVWYHRYCSHRAFRFRSLWFARIFLWTNPVCFREESYVLPHRVHHSRSDDIGDPYGPHLGWLGSYLATESQQNIKRDLTALEYERLSKSLEHIGFLRNSHRQFQRTGSVENVWHYGARALFANALGISISYWIGAGEGVLVWISAVFLYTFLVRDFNYRGHAGPFFKSCKGVPINQIFYGLVAGEWHENHHAHPRLARSGHAWWQIDVPYWIIRALAFSGVVVDYHAGEKSGGDRKRKPA